MSWFEILFILAFIAFPIIEQARKKGRGQGQGPELPGEGGPGSGRPGSRRPGSRRPGADPSSQAQTGQGGRSVPGRAQAGRREPDSAADMVPDDLWAVLTGQSKPSSAGTDVERAEAAEPDTPWSAEADRRSWEPAEPAEPPESDREPVFVEYEGPEAYSLERTGFEATSLERTDFRPLERRVPDSETRHRAFHDFIDRPKPKRRHRRSPIGRALRDPESLRNAFVLAEVLGKPKGLED